MNVGVLEITPDIASRFGETLAASKPHNHLLAEQLSHINAALAQGKRVFLLEWEGRHNPAGANLDGTIVASVCGGFACDAANTPIGAYRSLVVDGGQTGHFQQAIVTV